MSKDSDDIWDKTTEITSFPFPLTKGQTLLIDDHPVATVPETMMCESREQLAHIIRVERARAALADLQPGEWEDVMEHFCKSCGIADPHCQCWNDE